MAKKKKARPARGLIAQSVVPSIGRGMHTTAKGALKLPPWMLGALAIVLVLIAIVFHEEVVQMLFLGLVAIVGWFVLRRIFLQK